jgi:hypothetical protein
MPAEWKPNVQRRSSKVEIRRDETGGPASHQSVLVLEVDPYTKEQGDAICRWVDSGKFLETYDRVDIVPVQKG